MSFRIIKIFRLILGGPAKENPCTKWSVVQKGLTTPGLEYVLLMPIRVTARLLVCTVFYRSTMGIVGSNPTRGTDVCIFSVYGCCADSCSRSPTRCVNKIPKHDKREALDRIGVSCQTRRMFPCHKGKFAYPLGTIP
jgi:hypothetical protein